MNKLIMLAAGGTGGHLFPAQALAEALMRQDVSVELMSDYRVAEFGKNFPARHVHLIDAATLSFSRFWLLPIRAYKLFKGFMKAFLILRAKKPQAIVGFGGYPSLPPLLAARVLNIPIIIHEQNAVMGRANRLLAKFATAVASSFPQLRLYDGRAEFTGNPVRAAVRAQAGAAYPAMDEGFHLLIFGGSQGASAFAKLIPPAIAALDEDLRQKLIITQQCRPDDLEMVGKIYQGLGIRHELASFFTDMPERMAKAHLVIGRAGASTIAELGVIGRPALLIPLPGSIDQDQLHNAESFAQAGAGSVIAQSELTSARFAAFFTPLKENPGILVKQAKAALGQGVPDAAEKLAELVLKVAHLKETK